MKFNPIYDYSDSDLKNDYNLACWKFAELIKNLITISSDAKRQKEIIGIGAVCDEMALDFDSYFTLSYHSYLENNLLTSDQVEALSELDVFFEERSGDRSPDFWNDYLLETNPEWQIVRQKAFAILSSLGMSDLILEFDRKNNYKYTIRGRQITSQSTKTKLVRKI